MNDASRSFIGVIALALCALMPAIMIENMAWAAPVEVNATAQGVPLYRSGYSGIIPRYQVGQVRAVPLYQSGVVRDVPMYSRQRH